MDKCMYTDIWEFDAQIGNRRIVNGFFSFWIDRPETIIGGLVIECWIGEFVSPNQRVVLLLVPDY
jgi:hypothetical protein